MFKKYDLSWTYLVIILMSFAVHVNAKESTIKNLKGYQILKQRLGQYSIAAHQGGLFNYEPNTIQEFEYAYQKGMDIVEMDLRVTKDSIPVVYHDPDLDSWTDCTGLVNSYTLSELKRCHFKAHPDQTISSFEEILKWSKGKIIIDAEFKDLETINPALKLVKKYSAAGWTYFQVQSSPDKYYEAKKGSSEVALLFAVHNQEDIDFVKQVNDPALLIIEVTPETRDWNLMQEFKKQGKLITEDIWHFRKDWEIFGSACYRGLKAGINIAVSNRVKSCVKQKKKFLSEIGSKFVHE